MRILKQRLDFFDIAYPLKRIAPLEKLLFLDIETTGFTATSSTLYLIGCAYYAEHSWHTIQWFANEANDEAALLNAFFKFSSSYSHLIHFNGNNFDLPYLIQKCRQHELPYSFDNFIGIDLYKRTVPYKDILNLPNCKQKTIETFLDINRTDLYHGGELIGVYHDYLKAPTDLAFQALVLHNSEDIKGMLSILPILAYSDLFSEDLRVKKAQANYYSDINGDKQRELMLKLKIPAPLPVPISAFLQGCYFSGNGLDANMRIPIYTEEMKYFYSNYKDYYYLPSEDIALHKSVSSFVDKNHREKALASNCYTRKSSSYLPQWEAVFEPFFKRNYTDKEMFFELTEEMKSSRCDFSKYASHILHTLLKDQKKLSPKK